MKKKFMMAAVLLGALTLGSCVDDNESASVTAIRDAKAKQIGALANYQQAQADAELIIANADAAIKAAVAAYYEAEAKLKDLELQKAQATLETDIEKAKVDAEANLATAKAKLEQAKAALIRASDAADLATKAKIQNLIEAANAIMYGGTYYTYTYEYNGNYITTNSTTIDEEESLFGTDSKKGLKPQLIEKKADLVIAQHDLESTKALIQKYIEIEKADLAKNEALLKAYNDNKTTDKEEAQKSLDAANEALPAYVNAVNVATTTYNNAEEASDAAYDALETTELAQYLIEEIENPDRPGYYITKMQWINVNVMSALRTAGYTTFSSIISTDAPETEIINITYDDGTYYSNKYSDYNNKYVVDEEAIAAAVKLAERNLAIEKPDYDAAKEIYDEGMKTDNATHKGYINAVKAAQEAFDEDPTDANKRALIDAEDDLKEYLDGLQNSFEAATVDYDAAQEALDMIKEAQTKLTGDAYKNYSALYDKYVEAFKATIEPYIAKLKATHNKGVQDDLISTLTGVVNSYGTFDWDTKIKEVEEDIRDNNKKIAAMTDNGKPTDTKDDPDTPTKESAGYTEASRQAIVEQLTTEIKELEQQIAIMQAEYDDCMKQVEALIGGGSTETPAE